MRSSALGLALLLASCDGGAHAGPPRPPARSEPGTAAEPPPAPTPVLPAADPANLRRIEPCISLGYEVCFNALDDNCNGALEEGCGTPAGVVQFMIAWDNARADVDLNVTDPNGELIEAGRVAKSGLLKGRDCPGRRQECGGVNLENVFLEGNKPPTRGTYRVSVTLESLAGEPAPIWVTLSSRLGAKHYAYELRLLEPEDERHLELAF